MTSPCHSLWFVASFLTSGPCSGHHCSTTLTLPFIFLFTDPIFFADTVVVSSTRYSALYPSRYLRPEECFWIFRPNWPTVTVSPFKTDFRCRSFSLNRWRSCCDCLWHFDSASGTCPFLWHSNYFSCCLCEKLSHQCSVEDPFWKALSLFCWWNYWILARSRPVWPCCSISSKWILWPMRQPFDS